jgi:uncharacterized tellurite resistance protein B-like protein
VRNLTGSYDFFIKQQGAGVNMDSAADQSRFEGAQLICGEGGEAEFYDARFLISTLLIFVAKGDGNISNLESDKMIGLLSSKFDTRSAEALARLSTAIMALVNDADVVQKMQKISQGLSADEKSEVFAMLLELALADEELDAGEIKAIQQAGQILGLSQDAVHAALRSSSAGV